MSITEIFRLKMIWLKGIVSARGRSLKKKVKIEKNCQCIENLFSSREDFLSNEAINKTSNNTMSCIYCSRSYLDNGTTIILSEERAFATSVVAARE